jgi:hypothetical protein
MAELKNDKHVKALAEVETIRNRGQSHKGMKDVELAEMLSRPDPMALASLHNAFFVFKGKGES